MFWTFKIIFDWTQILIDYERLKKNCKSMNYKISVKDLLLLKNSAEIFNFLSDLPSELDEFELLEISSFEDVNSNAVEKERKKCFSKVVNDGSVFSTKCRQVKKRDVRRPPKNPSGVSVLKSIFGDFKGHDDLKSKNIRQTGKWKKSSKSAHF